MAEELKIMQKVFDMMQYGYGALAQYPKSEKFALCTDIKRCMDTMLERTIEAQRNTTKRLPCRIWMWKWQSCGLICG